MNGPQALQELEERRERNFEERERNLEERKHNLEERERVVAERERALGLVRVEPAKAKDAVNPSHYHGTAVDDFIEEFKLGFRLGNTVKYIARHQEKGTPIQDLEKAAWYLLREIERMKVKAKPLLDASCDKHQWRGRNDEKCPGCKP